MSIIWCSHFCVTHLFSCVVCFCGCFPVIHANVPKSEGIGLFLWDRSELHNRQKIHKNNMTITLILCLKKQETPCFNYSQENPIINPFAFPSSCPSSFDCSLNSPRHQMMPLTSCNASSLRHNHLHMCEIMINHVTNQTWKLRLIFGYLTPVNHLSCISGGERHNVFPRMTWTCGCVHVSGCFGALDLTCGSCYVSDVFSALVSRTCNVQMHASGSAFAQHHMSTSPSASVCLHLFILLTRLSLMRFSKQLISLAYSLSLLVYFFSLSALFKCDYEFGLI